MVSLVDKLKKHLPNARRCDRISLGCKRLVRYKSCRPAICVDYNNTIAQLQIEKPFMTVAEIDEEAVILADKMVRETFGSGEMKDRPEVVKLSLIHI